MNSGWKLPFKEKMRRAFGLTPIRTKEELEKYTIKDDCEIHFTVSNGEWECKTSSTNRDRFPMLLTLFSVVVQLIDEERNEANKNPEDEEQQNAKIIADAHNMVSKRWDKNERVLW